MTQFKITIESNDGHNTATWANEVGDVKATDFFLDLCKRVDREIKITQVIFSVEQDDDVS